MTRTLAMAALGLLVGLSIPLPKDIRPRPPSASVEAWNPRDFATIVGDLGDVVSTSDRPIDPRRVRPGARVRLVCGGGDDEPHKTWIVDTEGPEPARFLIATERLKRIPGCACRQDGSECRCKANEVHP